MPTAVELRRAGPTGPEYTPAPIRASVVRRYHVPRHSLGLTSAPSPNALQCAGPRRPPVRPLCGRAWSIMPLLCAVGVRDCERKESCAAIPAV